MAIVWLLIGLGILLAGAHMLEIGAVAIAEELGVSEVVIGVTIVAFGTSLPELAVSLASALKGEYGLAIGNVIARSGARPGLIWTRFLGQAPAPASGS